jgi:hypothetical protein
MTVLILFAVMAATVLAWLFIWICGRVFIEYIRDRMKRVRKSRKDGGYSFNLTDEEAGRILNKMFTSSDD